MNATTTSEESHHSAFHPTSLFNRPPRRLLTRLRFGRSRPVPHSLRSPSLAVPVGLGRVSPRRPGEFPSACPSISAQRPEIRFDYVSAIPLYPQPDVAGVDGDEDGLGDDMSLEDVLRPSNRSGSPFPLESLAGNWNLKYSYSGSFKSEPKVCTVPRLFNAVMNTIVTDEPFRQDAQCVFSKADTSHAYPLSRFLRHHLPRIPPLILARHLESRNSAELSRPTCSLSLPQRVLTRANPCR